MTSPRRWSALSTLASIALTLLVVPSVAAAQRRGFEQPSLSPTAQAVVSFLSVLVVGLILFAVAPRYVNRTVGRIHEDAVACFGWGLLVLVIFVGTIVVLAITVVGIVLVIPLAFLFVVIGIVGNTLGYLALFDRSIDSRMVALVAGAVIAGITGAIPILGGLVGFVVGSVGVGAMARDWRLGPGDVPARAPSG